MSWINSDGLEVKFGVEEAEEQNVGAYSVLGPVHLVEIMVKYDELPTVAQNAVVISQNFALPKGAVIESVEIVKPSTAFASSASGMLLNIGTVDASDGTSNADPDSLVDAATHAEYNAGGVNTSGWVGTAVGAPLAQASLITWEQDAQVATAGETTLRIKWSVPKVDGDTLAWTKP